MKKLILTVAFTLIATSFVRAQDSPLLMRTPTLNKTHIVFSYAGDLWNVGRDGGEASRLTTGVGREFSPLFSPKGQWIAFTGEYDGNVDVYVVAASGGVPKRLTYHPGGDGAVGWTPDGKGVIFASGRSSYANFTRLYTTGLDGGMPTEIALPMATRGSFSSDGGRIAYTPLSQWQPDWKRYRGGQTSPVLVANLADATVE